MRVVIIGGYGVFGGRLARLLLRDDHKVFVAGRRQTNADAFCAEHGGTPLVLDIATDLAPLFQAGPDLVVDAAGPFQFYAQAPDPAGSSDPYKVARACIEHGVSYLDLSDDAGFTAGISELDAAAGKAGVSVLSGVSSVPALSAAAVHALKSGFSELLTIETAILPGNRAPRGRAVMRSILSQAGNPMQVWRDGRWQGERAWCDSKWIAIGPDIRRRASLITVPDLTLFPSHFGARSVAFRAGLELSLLHLGLLSLSLLRSRGLLPRLDLFTGPARFIAGCLERFGSDLGGMLVVVSGVGDEGPVCRQWQLIAEAGHGPFVPATPARAIINNFSKIKPGARPCLNELPLSDYQAAMADLEITCATQTLADTNAR